MKKLSLLFILVVSSYCYYECPKCTFSDNGLTLKDSNKRECTLCDIGTCTLNDGTVGTDQSVCTVQTKLCEVGTSGMEIYKGYDTDGKGENCLKCRKGLSTSKPGYYSDSFSTPCDIRICQKGSYSLPEQKGYSTNLGQEGCKKCPLGFSTEKEGSYGVDDSICKVPTKKCKVGSYGENGYDLDGNGEGCENCPDQFSTKTDGTVGYAGNIFKNCVVERCPIGTYTLTEQKGFESDKNGKGCIPCPAGRSTKSKGAYGDDGIQACSYTKLCPAGQRSFDRGFDYGNCYKCPENSWSAEGSDKCTPCQENRQSPRGSTSINDCKCFIGFKEDGNGVCIQEIQETMSSPSIKTSSSKLAFISLFIFAINLLL